LTRESRVVQVNFETDMKMNLMRWLDTAAVFVAIAWILTWEWLTPERPTERPRLERHERAPDRVFATTS
jgi:uncharacterized membrane protein